MRKVLYILGQFDDSDIQWMSEAGEQWVLEAGASIIREGETIDHVFIILEGECEVSIQGLGLISTLRAGEVIGELSFIDRLPPSATVSATRTTNVLALPREALEAHTERDHAFGKRFYRALTLFMSDRLRSSLRQLMDGRVRPEAPQGGGEQAAGYTHSDAVLDNTTEGSRNFERLLERLSRAKLGSRVS